VRYIVKLMPSALRQLAVLAAWWRVHRPEAPELATNEVLAMATSLEQHPDRGIPLPSRRGQRRMLVTPRTKLLIVYRIRPRLRRVEIVRIRRP
jgi:plasmid stabilization system protein ParE